MNGVCYTLVVVWHAGHDDEPFPRTPRELPRRPPSPSSPPWMCSRMCFCWRGVGETVFGRVEMVAVVEGWVRFNACTTPTHSYNVYVGWKTLTIKYKWMRARTHIPTTHITSFSQIGGGGVLKFEVMYNGNRFSMYVGYRMRHSGSS